MQTMFLFLAMMAALEHQDGQVLRMLDFHGNLDWPRHIKLWWQMDFVVELFYKQMVS
jgi:hypothetical protein